MSHPVPGEAVCLSLHRLLTLGFGRVDAKSVKDAVDGGCPGVSELFVDDPNRVPNCRMELVLPAGIPPVQLVQKMLDGPVVILGMGRLLVVAVVVGIRT